MAAAVLANKVSKLESPKVFVDSAGTSNWHVGQGPNPPSKRTWEKAGYSFDHIASQFNYSRLVAADLVLVMDKDNHLEVSRYVTSEEEERKIYYLRQFDPSGPDSLEVPAESTTIFGLSISLTLLCNTAAAIGERQILP